MFNHLTKHFEVRQKYSSTLRVLFSTLFSMFGNVVKHGLSCLICYLRPEHTVQHFRAIVRARVLTPLSILWNCYTKNCMGRTRFFFCNFACNRLHETISGGGNTIQFSNCEQYCAGTSVRAISTSPSLGSCSGLMLRSRTQCLFHAEVLLCILKKL